MSWARRIREGAADAALGAWWFLRHRAGPVPGLDTGERAPVVLLPGVYERWQFLRPVAIALHEAGHPVHAVPELGLNVMSIPDAAATAQRRVNDLGLRRVVLVAHSKGGLIGKHMMAIDDTEHRIDRLVAITSPFGGSALARYAPSRHHLRTFSPTSEPLATLALNRELNARITSVFGAFDPVIPGRSALEGGTNIELPVGGHFRILSHPQLLEAVVRAVGAE